ncbi:MAG: transposase [Ruthenibacterium lactatiformans]|uniref:transposase n=1 Tax=Ruthenibacterium lactatiformans TaxID=1550024 RepID=UPI0015A628BB
MTFFITPFHYTDCFSVRQIGYGGNLCKTCPTRRMCTENARCEKTVLRHVWQDYVEMAEHVRHMAVYRELYRLRKEKIERVFADAKEKHGMRYTQYRGLAQVTNWVKLKFAAMNLKKIATWKWNARHPAPDGGKRTRTEENLAAVSLLFPFSFLLTNKKIALA